MNKSYNYNEAMGYITNKLGIKLFPHQQLMLKAFCEGFEVRTARCVGRSTVADAFGKYVAYKLGTNDYSKIPEITFPYKCAVESGLMTEDIINKFRRELKPEVFQKEFLCGDDPGEYNF